MADLPRSQALVRLDGPGHIMPVDPVTPPDSVAWRVIHRPSLMTVLGFALLALAATSLGALSLGFQAVGYIPGILYIAPIAGAVTVMVIYYLFVRLIERRPAMEELGLGGSVAEAGAGFVGGLAWSLASFLLLVALGGVTVAGFGTVHGLAVPFLNQLCTTIIMEIILCGLAFRLIERFIGSWLTLLLIAVAFGVARLASGDASVPAITAAVLSAMLLFGGVYMVTRRLWASLGLAAAGKVAQVALYGVMTPDGLQQGLVASYVAGPDWLTGGAAGTDAAIPALVVTAIVVAIVLGMAVRRGRIVRPAWQRGRVRVPVDLD